MKTMSMEHLYEFYTLEAMRAGMSMALSAKPELEFKHSFDRLAKDVNSAFDFLSETLAKRMRFYLWASAQGEARYASSRCEMHLEGISACDSRSAVYHKANDHPITTENIEAVIGVFDQHGWGSSYGGARWGIIAEAVKMFDEVTYATFIDHVVDLEHNGGNVFNKSDAKILPVQLDNKDLYEVRRYMDSKFSKDLLTNIVKVNVSFKVFQLVQRYKNIVNKKTRMSNFTVALEWLDEFDVEFGDETFELVDNNGRRNSGCSCEDCGDRIDRGDENYSLDDEILCDDCYNDKYIATSATI